jgi:arabinofuranan 3-O-arabinosyltransferase
MPRPALSQIIVSRRTWYVLSWLAALALTAWQGHLAWHMYDSQRTGHPAKDRRDANYGHTHIDFGGQWLIAHLFVTGHGDELYSRQAQVVALEAGYPEADEAPAATKHDAANLMHWLMELEPAGPDEPAIAGPLYPPTHALLFAPLGKLPPPVSYRIAQMILLAMGWIAGLAVTGISRGRVWWPAATMFIMVFPGFGPALHLAQNSAFSLAILLVGWWFVSRGWDGRGGAVWGLLAYKPVWAAAFLLVPLVTRRWRMLFAMAAVGLALVLATLPFVGVASWRHWFQIGRIGAETYRVDENWIFLSRDLLGIPRRWLLRFGEPEETRDRLAATIAGWVLWSAVWAGTVVVGLRRHRSIRGVDGYGAAFVALGAWATCFHFIYYDSLLAAFPAVLLLTDPQRFLRPTLLTISPVPRELAAAYSARPVEGVPQPAVVAASPMNSAILNSFVLTAVALLIFIEQGFSNLDVHASVSVGMLPSNGVVPNPLTFSTSQGGSPWDTFVLLALWAYCGARVLLGQTEKVLLAAEQRS